MSTKPRDKYLGKAYIRIIDKASKQKRAAKQERGTFDNVSMDDIREGLTNRTNAKKFARHKHREFMG